MAVLPFRCRAGQTRSVVAVAVGVDGRLSLVDSTLDNGVVDLAVVEEVRRGRMRFVLGGDPIDDWRADHSLQELDTAGDARLEVPGRGLDLSCRWIGRYCGAIAIGL